MDSEEAAGQIASLLYSLCIIFCGVLATPAQMPGFWIFMYRVSPFHYLISGLMTVSVSNAAVTCATNELLQFQPAQGQTCGEYMADYIQSAGAGYLLNQDDKVNCSFCKMDSTNSYLASLDSYYEDRWWEFGLMWAYIVFNILAALGHYWLRRVPKKRVSMSR